MPTEIPQGKIHRGAIGGKTVAQVGGKVIGYYTKRPFLSQEKKARAKAALTRDSADILFKGLSLLKGTAVKVAQMLSFEMDLLPPAVCEALAKSYNQVPPMNPAMVRKAIFNAFGRPVETVFKTFDTKAFAAASLGQVHRACGPDGIELAVKIQYPGIAKTIDNDLKLVKNLLRPFVEYDLLLPALTEIEARLLEEVDYEKEASSSAWFKRHLKQQNIFIPRVDQNLSNETVLSAGFQAGLPLNEWLQKGPSQAARNQVAQKLNDLFMDCLYDLNRIHADPNPGNFIIAEDLSIGLVDFGCVKRFDAAFVDCYRQLVNAIVVQDDNRHMALLQQLGMIKKPLDPDTEKIVADIFNRFGHWLGRLFEKEYFDFDANSDFMKDGKAISQDVYKLRKHFEMNPDFVFLDRTRYGLLRLFEQMGARVRIRNPYECKA